MRHTLLAILLVFGCLVSGCHKKRTLANFTFKEGMTAENFEDEFGSPDKTDAHWIAYKLDDGTELRLYFLAGARGTTRTLTSAQLLKGGLNMRQLFTAPLSVPAAQPPATFPSTTLPATTLPSTNPINHP